MTTRRSLLLCFLALLAAPTSIVRGGGARAEGDDRIIIIDGWVLLEDDVRKIAAHAV